MPFDCDENPKKFRKLISLKSFESKLKNCLVANSDPFQELIQLTKSSNQD